MANEYASERCIFVTNAGSCRGPERCFSDAHRLNDSSERDAPLACRSLAPAAGAPLAADVRRVGCSASVSSSGAVHRRAADTDTDTDYTVGSSTSRSSGGLCSYFTLVRQLRQVFARRVKSGQRATCN